MSLLLALKYTKTLLRNLFLPPAGPMLVAIVGLLLLRRAPRLGRGLIIVGIGSLWLMATPVVADRLAALVEHDPALDLAQPTNAQAIVILGGGGQREFAPEYGGGEAEPYLLERLAYGAYVSQHTGLPVMVTGFRDEGTVMRDTLLRHFGIHARWVDTASYDTFENARNSARMLRADGVERVILVTRSTHMWRSVQEFIGTGLQVVPAPVGVTATRDRTPFSYFPDLQALTRSHDALYEWLGELVRRTLALTHLRRH
jgi:uncharacterized SAM-binding protein YcdF (DUF218 family)